MFIGIGRFDLYIPASASLKDKRHVVRSVVTVVSNKFKVAIAEVDYHDLWQRSAIGVSCVASSVGHCRRILQEIEKTIARTATDGAEIVDRSVRIVAIED